MFKKRTRNITNFGKVPLDLFVFKMIASVHGTYVPKSARKALSSEKVSRKDYFI